MNEDKIMRKLLQHDKHFKQVDTHFKQVDTRLDHIDIRLDKMTNMLLDHEDRLVRIEENMATKQDIRGIHDTLDVVVKMLKKHEEEGIFMAFRIQENTKDIHQNIKDILQIKSVVGLT